MTAPLWLNRLRPGMRLPVPDFVCVQDLVRGYADLFDARHLIHVDEAFAKTTRYGRRIAHGPLPLAKVLGSLGEVFGTALQVMIAIDEWQFIAPIFVGDTYPVECFVTNIAAGSSGKSGVVTVELRLLGSNGDLVQRGAGRLLVSLEPPAASSTRSDHA